MSQRSGLLFYNISEKSIDINPVKIYSFSQSFIKLDNSVTRKRSYHLVTHGWIMRCKALLNLECDGNLAVSEALGPRFCGQFIAGLRWASKSHGARDVNGEGFIYTHKLVSSPGNNFFWHTIRGWVWVVSLPYSTYLVTVFQVCAIQGNVM